MANPCIDRNLQEKKVADMKDTKLEDGVPKCIACKQNMKVVNVKLGNNPLRAWRCSKCGEEIIHPVDAQKALVLAKLKKRHDVKVGILNRAPYVRFPKEFGNVVHKGDVISILLESPKDIRLKVKHVSCK